MDDKARLIRTKLVWCVVGTSLIGAIGGGMGLMLGAPFYFGFFLGFVLAGMVSLFVIAAHMSGPAS